MSIGRYLALAGLAFALTACTLLPQAEPVQVYLLPAASLPPASTTKIDRVLRISRPRASMILSSTRIAVIPAGSQLSSYKGARWSDEAPALLRDRLVELFIDDGRFTTVSSDDQHLLTDLDLQGSLAAFQAEYRNGRPVVVIRYDAHLASSGSQRILASRRFEVHQPSDGEQLEAVVAAFGQASERLARQLIDWTATQAAAGR
ncbi:ABC-type transport auxiliary lipoprotein family protein [Zestomonas thermotolerans]|uniref:ABC-type transport auxiliary lipoprotein family protein n=1 Tax=Zestomonas thermotolerans TaxID=157784 RepID=UPI000485BDDE|nr:ABC-type transport auxiliary lipoprotein family protein [Pseudomonas thermotolerans]